jgi:cytochrome oxidase Cu insertion factor (SCO1/SenC/PrrC family)
MRNTTGRSRLTAAALALWFAASGLLFAVQQPGTQSAATPDVQKLGPQIGSRIPDFALADQHGVQRTLASLMGAKGLMLVFYRSADW